MIVEVESGPSAAVRFSRSAIRSGVEVPAETSLQATSLSSPATAPSIRTTFLRVGSCGQPWRMRCSRPGARPSGWSLSTTHSTAPAFSMM